MVRIVKHDYKVLYYKGREVRVRITGCAIDPHYSTVIVGFGKEAYQMIITCRAELASQYFELYTAERWITELRDLNACRLDGDIKTQLFMALPLN